MYIQKSFSRSVLVLLLMVLLSSFSNAQSLRKISNSLFQPDEWYGSEESKNVAENVLILQKENGGWPKNFRKYKSVLSQIEKDEILKSKGDIKEATIDNGATYSEMVFLARMYKATKNEKFKKAFCEGLNFIFSIQYPNGGFKQFSRSTGYYTHITFNDNATYNVLSLIRAIATGDDLFSGINNDEITNKCKKSFESGIDCILKTQYIQNGKKTVWCAQHDEITLKPAKARAYELPSLSGQESVGLVILLMDIEKPDSSVINAVDAAMAWFENNRIKDYRLERFINSDGKPDLKMVKSNNGPDLWGRFCDLNTNRAFVCDRDGIVKYDISEIGYERRTGYGWYTSDPERLIKRYNSWKEKIKEVRPQ
jgi:pectinesterase